MVWRICGTQIATRAKAYFANSERKKYLKNIKYGMIGGEQLNLLLWTYLMRVLL